MPDGPEPPTDLVDFLTGMYRDGTLRANEVATGAAAAVSSVSRTSRDVQAIAKAKAKKKIITKYGKERAHTAHCARALQRVLKKRSTMPPVYRFLAPVWDVNRNCKVNDTMAILLPHEVLDSQIEEGCEREYCDATDEQPGLHAEKLEWLERTGVDVGTDPLASLGLWGDAALAPRMTPVQVAEKIAKLLDKETEGIDPEKTAKEVDDKTIQQLKDNAKALRDSMKIEAPPVSEGPPVLKKPGADSVAIGEPRARFLSPKEDDEGGEDGEDGEDDEESERHGDHDENDFALPMGTTDLMAW